MDALKFVIVGHVDHGKSTLIGRLLYDTNSLPPDKIEEIKKSSQNLGRGTEFAYLLDHLEEERLQGITIDTTQVFFKSKKREYVIIDAPGHVEFVKNMITGASQAEAAVLIVDASEGIREQTKRHAFILSLLGIKQVIVLINKMDLIDFSEDIFNKIKTELIAFLDSIKIKPIFYIPISAVNGDNIASKSLKMQWYKSQYFLECLDTLRNKEPLSNKPLIFPVQDVYRIDDKRITAGRIEAGTLKEGQDIIILPTRQSTKVKTIEKFLEQKNTVQSGECIGITTSDSVFLNRGDVIIDKQSKPVLTDEFKASLFWMSKKDLIKDNKITIRCSTQETTCKITEIKERINSSTLELIETNSQILKNLETGEVIIKTKKPMTITSFDDVQELGRFVLVQDENICAGGIIASVEM